MAEVAAAAGPLAWHQFLPLCPPQARTGRKVVILTLHCHLVENKRKELWDTHPRVVGQVLGTVASRDKGGGHRLCGQLPGGEQEHWVLGPGWNLNSAPGKHSL